MVWSKIYLVLHTRPLRNLLARDGGCDPANTHSMCARDAENDACAAQKLELKLRAS